MKAHRNGQKTAALPHLTVTALVMMTCLSCQARALDPRWQPLASRWCHYTGNQQSVKDGIVIDVRYNGGGWTTDYLMAVLNVEQHAYTIPRGATDNLDKDQKKFRDKYPYSERLPLSAWTKPSIAMSNENSYSNAEIFSHAYKALGIGKLVGRPTFGAVISTGAERLVDELLQSL